MTAREEARRKAEVMLAFAEGKEVEFKSNDGSEDSWERVVFPEWSWSSFDYRIAQPEKRKVEMWQWVARQEGQLPLLTHYFFRTLKEASNYYYNNNVNIIQRADWTRIEVEE